MKLRPLMIGFSMLAFAGAAAAADEAKKSFSELDRDGNGTLSMMEAAADRDAKQHFQRMDENNDFRLSRAEYEGSGRAAAGGQKQGSRQMQDNQAQDVRTWDLTILYRDAWSAESLIDTPVRGEKGEEIGDVKDIVVDKDGRIAKLIVEVGGFFEMGDQHIGVPWKDVAFGLDGEFVRVPLREVESGTYSLHGRVPQGEDVPITEGHWRVNELIGDYASLQDVPRYGIVTDVIFDSRGRAQGVVIDRATGSWGRAGWHGYPYAGYSNSWDYRLPYSSSDIAVIQPYDYGRLARESRYAGEREGAAAAGGSQKSGFNVIRHVERQLAANGYDVKADGVMDQQTRQALERFQQKQGLKATGRLDEETLTALDAPRRQQRQ